MDFENPLNFWRSQKKTRADLEADLRALQSEAAVIENAPMARPDALSKVKQIIDAKASTLDQRMATALPPILAQGGRRFPITDDALASFNLFAVSPGGGLVAQDYPAQHVEKILCALHPEQVLAAVDRAFKIAGVPDGPTLAEREVKLQKINQQIAAVTAKINALDTEANKLRAELSDMGRMI